MIGLIIEYVVNLGLSNNLYQFENEIRLQQDKGPTGYDMTGLAADVYMLWWDRRFEERLEELKFKMDLNIEHKIQRRPQSDVDCFSSGYKVL